MIQLPDKWNEYLVNQPEAGMGYQIVSVILNDGRRYDHVIVNSGYITRIKDIHGIPFTVSDIKEIIVTNDKWDFNLERGYVP